MCPLLMPTLSECHCQGTSSGVGRGAIDVDFRKIEGGIEVTRGFSSSTSSLATSDDWSYDGDLQYELKHWDDFPSTYMIESEYDSTRAYYDVATPPYLTPPSSVYNELDLPFPGLSESDEINILPSDIASSRWTSFISQHNTPSTPFEELVEPPSLSPRTLPEITPPSSKRRKLNPPRASNNAKRSPTSRQPSVSTKIANASLPADLRMNEADVYLVIEQRQRETSKDCTVKEVFVPASDEEAFESCLRHLSCGEEIKGEVSFDIKAVDGSLYRITFKSTTTSVVAVPSFDIPGDSFAFVHFPPNSMIAPLTKSMSVGENDWWRLQGCKGPVRHAGMGGDGQWTARNDKVAGVRRLARILGHFADCPQTEGSRDPLRSLARALLFKNGRGRRPR